MKPVDLQNSLEREPVVRSSTASAFWGRCAIFAGIVCLTLTIDSFQRPFPRNMEGYLALAWLLIGGCVTMCLRSYRSFRWDPGSQAILIQCGAGPFRHETGVARDEVDHFFLMRVPPFKGHPPDILPDFSAQFVVFASLLDGSNSAVFVSGTEEDAREAYAKLTAAWTPPNASVRMG